MFKIVLTFALLAVALADVSQYYRPRPAVPARRVQPTYQYNKPAAPVYSAAPKYGAPVRTPSYAPVRAAAPKYSPFQGGRVPSSPAVGILRQDSNIQPDGSYSYLYDTGNGIHAQEQGSVHQVGRGRDLANAAQGSYSYISPEGEQVSVSYLADENGFQPQGSHIPQVPEAILRSLAYNEAHPEQQEPVRVGNNRRYNNYY